MNYVETFKFKSNHIYWYMAALRLDNTITVHSTQSHKVAYCH